MDLLTAGVDPGVATQIAMMQALGKMRAAPTSPSRRKRIFGLERGADDAEAEEGPGSDDGATGSMPGSCGTAASLRLRAAMKKHPEHFIAEIRRRAAAAMEDDRMTSQPDLAIRLLAEEVPVQQQKAMGYLLNGIAHVNRALHEGRSKDAELLTWRLLAAGDQCCLDGTWKTAWGVTGLAEPNWGRWGQLDVALLRRTHGASRLLGDSWVSIETQRLKDAAFLMKQRNTTPGKGGAKGDGP